VGQAPGDADVRVVDVVLAVVGADQLLVVVHPEGDDLVDQLKEIFVTCSTVQPFRVARFFIVHFTKTGENIPNDHRIYQIAIKSTKLP
jgi:hypothetical protein